MSRRCLANVDHGQPLSRRFYHPAEVDLVTRNAVLENGLLSDVPMVDPEMLPFGDKAIVVVRFGGSAQSIKRFELNEETFNAVAADNAVLYPEELALE